MPGQRFTVHVDGQAHETSVEVEAGDGARRVTVGDKEYHVRAVPGGDWLVEDVASGARRRVTLDGRSPARAAVIAGVQCSVEVVSAAEVARARARAGARARGGRGTVTSPMPGRVVRVLVREGEVVEAGAAVVIVEAMKMENELTAPIDGRVSVVAVAEGAVVESAQTLIEIVAIESEPEVSPAADAAS